MMDCNTTSMEIYQFSKWCTQTNNQQQCKQSIQRIYFSHRLKLKMVALSSFLLVSYNFLIFRDCLLFFRYIVSNLKLHQSFNRHYQEKGFVGAELMNVSLLAMSNSLAESFIIVNSIFFGVSDIGISTVVQQAAFYGLINQGTKFYTNILQACFI